MHVLRALEHQVLEEMREPGAPGLLVLRADVIHELQVDDRRRMVFRQHQRQTVRQFGDLVQQFRRAYRGGRGLRGDADEGRDQRDGGQQARNPDLHDPIIY